MMKRILLFIALTPLYLFAQDKLIVYDEMIEERSVRSFSEIQVEGGIDIYLSQDKKYKLVVSAATEGSRDRIMTQVEGNRLRIFTEYKKSKRNYVGGDQKMKVYLSVPELDKISAGGASDVFILGGFIGKNLSIYLGGASDFVGAMQVDNLVLVQSGSSDAKLSGSVTNLQVKVSGASDLKGFGCKVDYLKALATGASKIEITVEKELEVIASGASDVYFKGKGVVVKQSSSGASTIKSIDK